MQTGRRVSDAPPRFVLQIGMTRLRFRHRHAGHFVAGLNSIDDVQAKLAAENYVCGRPLATVVFLALKLGRPLFLEGEAGMNSYVYDWVDGEPRRKSLDYARQLLAEAGLFVGIGGFALAPHQIEILRILQGGATLGQGVVRQAGTAGKNGQECSHDRQQNAMASQSSLSHGLFSMIGEP